MYDAHHFCKSKWIINTLIYVLELHICHIITETTLNKAKISFKANRKREKLKNKKEKGKKIESISNMIYKKMVVDLLHKQYIYDMSINNTHSTNSNLTHIYTPNTPQIQLTIHAWIIHLYVNKSEKDRTLSQRYYIAF